MLIDKLPGRYAKSSEIVTFQKALDPAVNTREEELESFFKQLNVWTADWGLALWEKQYGIETDLSKTLNDRRARLISKMRGSGTTTVEMIKNVAESFVNGQVEIDERWNEYHFDIRMVSVIGIPSNMEDLRAAIEEIKPAHLDFDIIIKYNTYNDAARFTHDQLAKYTYYQIREEALH